jgi:hypothetical protein
VQQDAAPPLAHHLQQQQQLWQVPAADAGQAGADVSAQSAASIGKYQAKLAQLRQLKEQLLRKTYGDASSAADATTATPLISAQGRGLQQDAYALQQQQQQGQQLLSAAAMGAAPVPAATAAGVWTPRSAQGDWLIGTGNQGPVLSTSGTSMDHASTCSAYSAGGAGGSAAAYSSSGGGSLLSAWSGQGKSAAAGGSILGGVEALGGSGRHADGPTAPLRLSRLSGSMHKANAAGDGLASEQQQELPQQVQGAHSSPAAAAPAGDMKQWVRAVSNAASLDAAAAAATAAGGCGSRSAPLQGRSSLRRSSSSLKESSRHSLREAGGASAKELPGGSYRSSAASAGPAAGSGEGGDGFGLVAPHGLTSKSPLQRWAQPQTQQQQQQQPAWQRQSSSAAGSRRATGSGRSSLV